MYLATFSLKLNPLKLLVASSGGISTRYYLEYVFHNSLYISHIGEIRIKKLKYCLSNSFYAFEATIAC